MSMNELSNHFLYDHHRKLLPEEASTAAHLLSQAFITNPVYSAIFKKHQLQTGLSWLFERNIRMHSKCELSFGVSPPSTSSDLGLIATMTWVPPSETRFGLLDYLEEGILLMPLRFGITSMRKMLAASKRNHEMIDQVTQGKPHQYLSMVAVHPKLQGRGIGRKMIERYLAVEIDCTDGKRLPVVLTTQLESNVRFYRHLGFEVRATHEVRVSGIRYTNWTMTRE